MARSLACAFFLDAEPLGEPGCHSLDACALCAKPLPRNSDIFMYRGDTPFCSEDCRYEQMHHDATCARQASSRRKQLGRHEATAASPAPAPAPAPAAAAAVSRKADVSVAS